jgi:uncharacterized protein
MKHGAGGTQGGIGQFFVGLALACVSAYLFFDSVHVSTAPSGWISGLIGGHAGGLSTVSAGLLFLPFFLGVMALFVNAKQTWAWILTWAGLGILVVEILSRLRFFMEMKLTHLLILVALMAAGCGLIFRSFRDFVALDQQDKTPGDS